MIPFLELFLKKLIVNEINYIKTNPDIIDRMFSLLDVSSSSAFKMYLTTNSIKVT
jgi:hypothetical protein